MNSIHCYLFPGSAVANTSPLLSDKEHECILGLSMTWPLDSALPQFGAAPETLEIDSKKARYSEKSVSSLTPPQVAKTASSQIAETEQKKKTTRRRVSKGPFNGKFLHVYPIEVRKKASDETMTIKLLGCFGLPGSNSLGKVSLMTDKTYVVLSPSPKKLENYSFQYTFGGKTITAKKIIRNNRVHLIFKDAAGATSIDRASVDGTIFSLHSKDRLETWQNKKIFFIKILQKDALNGFETTHGAPSSLEDSISLFSKEEQAYLTKKDYFITKNAKNNPSIHTKNSDKDKQALINILGVDNIFYRYADLSTPVAPKDRFKIFKHAETKYYAEKKQQLEPTKTEKVSKKTRHLLSLYPIKFTKKDSTETKVVELLGGFGFHPKMSGGKDRVLLESGRTYVVMSPSASELVNYSFVYTVEKTQYKAKQVVRNNRIHLQFENIPAFDAARPASSSLLLQAPGSNDPLENNSMRILTKMQKNAYLNFFRKYEDKYCLSKNMGKFTAEEKALINDKSNFVEKNATTIRTSNSNATKKSLRNILGLDNIFLRYAEVSSRTDKIGAMCTLLNKAKTDANSKLLEPSET